MSGQHSVRQDDSLLSRLDQIFFKLESALNLLGGAVILLLVLLATTNILGRWFFNLPVNGYIDWVEQAMAFMAFLGLAYTQRQGSHIRMDILVSRLRGRWLWFSEFVSTLLLLLISTVLVYGSWLHFLRAYELGDSSLDIELPTWPAKLVVPVALSLLSLRLLLQLWGYLRALREDSDEPVAVPLIEDAATSAIREADVLLQNKPGQDH